MKGESDASGCAACQRLRDPVRGSEGVDGTGGNGVLNSGSVVGIDVEVYLWRMFCGAVDAARSLARDTVR